MSLPYRAREVASQVMQAPAWMWWLLVGGLASGLMLVNLGNHYLWQDEAQTALIAQTILERGLPYGTDSLNFFSQELGAEYGEGYIWKWHTWLSFYAAALSFQLFGATTFTARLPFALFGLASIVLVFIFCDRHWGRRTAVIACVLALTCVPFFLLARQCRYYSAAAFFSLLALHYYLEIFRSRPRAWLYFALAATGLFQTHYVYQATLLASVVGHQAFFGRRNWKPVVHGVALAVFLGLPWMVWLSSMRYGEQYGGVVASGAAALGKLTQFAIQLDYVVSFYAVLSLLILGLFSMMARRFAPECANGHVAGHSAPAPVFLLATFVLINLAVLAISSPAAFFRYLAPLVLPLLILCAWGLASLQGVFRWAIPIVLAVAVTRQPLADYAYELGHDYDGPIEGIVEFLKQRANPGDVVAITYGDLPVKFYTGLRVVGGLAGDDLQPALQARWVVLRRHTIADKDAAVRDYLTSHLSAADFRIHRLPYPDLPFENREAPGEHLYRTVHGYFPVIVLERIR